MGLWVVLIFYFLHFLWNVYNNYQLVYNSEKNVIMIWRKIWKIIKMGQIYSQIFSHSCDVNSQCNWVFQFACYDWKIGDFFCSGSWCLSNESQAVTFLLFAPSTHHLGNPMRVQKPSLAWSSADLNYLLRNRRVPC